MRASTMLSTRSVAIAMVAASLAVAAPAGAADRLARHGRAQNPLTEIIGGLPGANRQLVEAAVARLASAERPRMFSLLARLQTSQRRLLIAAVRALVSSAPSPATKRAAIYAVIGVGSRAQRRQTINLGNKELDRYVDGLTAIPAEVSDGDAASQQFLTQVFATLMPHISGLIERAFVRLPTVSVPFVVAADSATKVPPATALHRRDFLQAFVDCILMPVCTKVELNGLVEYAGELHIEGKLTHAALQRLINSIQAPTTRAAASWIGALACARIDLVEGGCAYRSP